MAIARQVITSLQHDGTDMLGTKALAVKIADESIVSGSLLTVESNHFCVLKSRGAALLRNEPEIKSGLEAIRSTLRQREPVLLGPA